MSEIERNKLLAKIYKKIKIIGIGGFGKVFSIFNTVDEKE